VIAAAIIKAVDSQSGRFYSAKDGFGHHNPLKGKPILEAVWVFVTGFQSAAVRRELSLAVWVCTFSSLSRAWRAIAAKERAATSSCFDLGVEQLDVDFLQQARRAFAFASQPFGAGRRPYADLPAVKRFPQ
jgi:hypothetical protein